MKTIGVFSQAATPGQLLESAPTVIWPGFMPANFLPLIGNTTGDWLCVKVDESGFASRIFHWYHGGGDWLPWGESLSEALIFNACQRVPAIGNFGDSANHLTTLPSRLSKTQPTAEEIEDDPALTWASKRKGIAISDLISKESPLEFDLDALLNSGVSEIAIRFLKSQQLLSHWPQELIESVMGQGSGDSVLSGLGQHEASMNLSQPRIRLAKCLFDVDFLPEATRRQLMEADGGIQNQRWDAAAGHAFRVTEISPDLAWAWDIVGYNAEKRGEAGDAITAYQKSSECSAFTDQSACLHSYWTESVAAKFSVARLKEIAPELIDQSAYYTALMNSDSRECRRQVVQYWMSLGASMMSSDRPMDANRCFYAAGWDIGAQPMSQYATVYGALVESLNASGMDAQAELAETHRRCLRDRYGY